MSQTLYSADHIKIRLPYRYTLHKMKYDTDNVNVDHTGFVQIRYTDMLGRFPYRYFQTDDKDDLDDLLDAELR